MITHTDLDQQDDRSFQVPSRHHRRCPVRRESSYNSPMAHQCLWLAWVMPFSIQILLGLIHQMWVRSEQSPVLHVLQASTSRYKISSKGKQQLAKGVRLENTVLLLALLPMMFAGIALRIQIPQSQARRLGLVCATRDILARMEEIALHAHQANTRQTLVTCPVLYA